MVDLPSLHGLIRQMPQGARLLLVGDERQLPPVGFGLLFNRFVEDPSVTSTLTTVHRQAATTSIPEVASQIRRRVMPDLAAYVMRAKGVMLARVSGREAIADRVVSIWNEFDDDDDVMIITPVNDGPCGVTGLNRRLHDEYLRTKDLQELRGPLGDLFSPGEPVVYRRNCYKRGLFNGSIGIVRRIDRAERHMIAIFDGVGACVRLGGPGRSIAGLRLDLPPRPRLGRRVRHHCAAAEPFARPILALHCYHARPPTGDHRRAAGDYPGGLEPAIRRRAQNGRPSLALISWLFGYHVEAARLPPASPGARTAETSPVLPSGVGGAASSKCGSGHGPSLVPTEIVEWLYCGGFPRCM